MKKASHANGTSEPTLKEIELEYRYVLALRCAACLQCPPLTIVITSPVISHAMIVSRLTQHTKVADYWSPDVTSVVAGHPGCFKCKMFCGI